MAAYSRYYWPVSVEQVATTTHTHAAVRGIVAPGYPRMEADGDVHIRLNSLTDPTRFIVAECTPKEPCAKPRAGQTITVSGITRRDPEHGWWEVHPVESWQ